VSVGGKQMISSILLIALNLMGKINVDKGIGFLKPYFLGLAVEVIICIITIPKIMDKLDERKRRIKG
jgi:hypothetical protein